MQLHSDRRSDQQEGNRGRPGGDPEKILARLQAHGLTLVSIIHTHAHFDHFLASGKLKELTGATLHLHKDDQPLWDNLQMQCQMFGVPYTPVPPPDRWLGDDEELACGCGVALHTPGHTPGSMSFWFADAKLLIAGDTLFRRGIGRTDLWGGDQRAIVRSIKERLYRPDEEAVVVTGHGRILVLATKCAKILSCGREVSRNYSASLRSKAGIGPSTTFCTFEFL